VFTPRAFGLITFSFITSLITANPNRSIVAHIVLHCPECHHNRHVDALVTADHGHGMGRLTEALENITNWS
jgi:hypothetical protein